MDSKDELKENPYQVCILGGGFGGVNTALTLESVWEMLAWMKLTNLF